MKINFISKINKSENKKIIWFLLSAGFILSIYDFVRYEIISPYFILDLPPSFADIPYIFSSGSLFLFLWNFLPYTVFSIVAFKMKKEKVLLTIIGLIMVLIHIYLYYISYISTSVLGSSLTVLFTPIILMVSMFVLIGVEKLLKFIHSKFKN